MRVMPQPRAPSAGGRRVDPATAGFAMLVLDAPQCEAHATPAKEAEAGADDEESSAAPSAARFAQLFDLDPEAAGEVSATIDRAEWLFGGNGAQSEAPDDAEDDGLWPDEMVLLSFTPVDEMISESVAPIEPEEEGVPEKAAGLEVVVEETVVSEEATGDDGSLAVRTDAGGGRAERATSPVWNAGARKRCSVNESPEGVVEVQAETAAVFDDGAAKVECAEAMKVCADQTSSAVDVAGEDNCAKLSVSPTSEAGESAMPSVKISCDESESNVQREVVAEVSEAVGSVEDDLTISAPSAARFAQLVDLDPEAAGEVSATIDPADWLFGESAVDSDYGSMNGEQLGFAHQLGWPDGFADDGFAMLVLDAPLVSMSEVKLSAPVSGRSSKLSDRGQDGGGALDDSSGDSAPSRARFAQLVDLDQEAADEMSTTVDPSDWIFSDTDAESGHEMSAHGEVADLTQCGIDEFVTLSCTPIADSGVEEVVTVETDVDGSVCPAMTEDQTSAPAEVITAETGNTVLDESASAAPSAAHFAQFVDLDPEAAGEVSATIDRSEWLLGDQEAESGQTDGVQSEQLESVKAPEWPGEANDGGFAMMAFDAPLLSPSEIAKDIAVTASSAEVAVLTDKGGDDKDATHSTEDDSSNAAPSAARFAQLIDLDPEAAGEVSATLDPADWLFGDSEAESGRHSVQSQRMESCYPAGQALDDVVTLSLTPHAASVVQSGQVESKAPSSVTPFGHGFVSLNEASSPAVAAPIEEESEPASISRERFVQLVDLDEDAAMDLSSAPYQDDFGQLEPDFFGFGEAVTLVFAPPVQSVAPTFVAQEPAAVTDSVPTVENWSVEPAESAVPDGSSLTTSSGPVAWPVAVGEIDEPRIIAASHTCELPSEAEHRPIAVTPMTATVIIEAIDSNQSPVDGSNEVDCVPGEMADGFASLVFEVPDATAPASSPAEVPPAKEVSARQLPFSVENSVAALASAIAEQSKSIGLDTANASHSSSVSGDRYIQGTDLETPRIASASDGSLAMGAHYLQGDDLDGRGITGMMTDSSRPGSGAATFREFEPQQVIPGTIDEQRARNPRRATAGGRLRRSAHKSQPEAVSASEADNGDSLTVSQGWDRSAKSSVREPGAMRAPQGRPSVPSPRRQRPAPPGTQASLASRFLAGSQVACDDPEALAATVWELEDRLETSTGGAHITDSGRTERAVEVARAQLMDSLKHHGQERRQAEAIARSTCSRTEVEEFQRMMAQREQQLEIRLREQVHRLREKQSKEIAEHDAQWTTEPPQRLFNRSSHKGRAPRLQRQLLMSSHRCEPGAQAMTIGERLAQSDMCEPNGAMGTGFEASRAQLEQKHKDEMDTLLQACDVRRGEFRFLKETLVRRFNGRPSGLKADDQNGAEIGRLWGTTPRKDNDATTGLTGSPRRRLMAAKVPSIGEFTALPLPPLSKEVTSRRRGKMGGSGKA